VGKMRQGRAADHSPPSSAAVMEEYPPSGPNGASANTPYPFTHSSPTTYNFDNWQRG